MFVLFLTQQASSAVSQKVISRLLRRVMSRPLALGFTLFLSQAPSGLAQNHYILPGAPYPSSALHWPARPADYDVPPKLIRGDAPIYPVTQVFAHKKGVAVVAFTVGADGATHNLRVVRASYPFFGSHTILAVRNWKFEPARKNGKPVPVSTTMSLPFGGRYRSDP